MITDIPNCVLYVGDNVEVMRREIPDTSVQLTVTSPPYDNLRTYNGFTWDFESVAKELYRVTKTGGVVVWVVADATVNGSETGTSFRQALYFRECGFNLHDTMIYEKTGTGACGSNLSYWQIFEYMFVFSKGRPNAINLIKDSRNVKFGAVQTRGRLAADGTVKDSRRRTVPEFSVRSNVWRIQQGNNGDDKTTHPAKYPEKLAEGHILSWSNQGDLVLDPFSGSGTTGKAALLNSRRFIGVDISPAYVDLSAGRIRKALNLETCSDGC